MIINSYLNRIAAIIYYVLHAPFYRHLNFKAAVFFSVRVQGKKWIRIGRDSVIQRLGWLLALRIDEHEPELTIGENCAIGDFCHIAAVRRVTIGNNVLMANKVYISDNVHDHTDVTMPVILQPVRFKAAVTIHDGAWIGENVCIIGADVGLNSVVGANSVVTRSIPDYCIAAGIPARVIKRYDFDRKEWVKVP